MRKANAHPPFNIILLGDPAAGKATQAEYIVKKYGLYDFDMGKELTLLRARDASVDARLKVKTDKGNLSPTEIVRGIIKEKIATTPKTQGILFDGHPKMLGEAKLIAKLLHEQGRGKPLVMYLTIPTTETIERIQKRKGYFAGKFGKRADDSVVALKNRVSYYRKNVSQVIEFFQSKYTYKKISGMGTREEVKAVVVSAIEKYLKNIDTTSNK